MGAFIPNKEATRAAALASIDALEARFATNVARLVHDTDHYIKSKTPVYTGQAVRNYIWTMGAGSSTVLSAIDNGPTGHTNNMALGTEPRRAPNEAAAASTLASLDFANPFHAYVLTNNSPDIGGLEEGALPGAPLRPRSPNGMFNLTQHYMSELLAVKGILS